MTWNLQPLHASGNAPLTTHRGEVPVEIYGAVLKRETWKLVILGKGYSPETSSILDPVAASQTCGSQPKSDSGNKELSIASEEKELPWQSTEIFLAKILFFFLFPSLTHSEHPDEYKETLPETRGQQGTRQPFLLEVITAPCWSSGSFF